MAAPPSAPASTPRQQNEVLATLAIAALMVMYVETMIVPAIPVFRTFFDGASLSLVAWILTSYLLVGVVATPIVAKLGDIYGKKRVLLGVLTVYAVAVSIAGFSPDIASDLGISRANAIYLLIGIRAVQGVGIAMFPLAFALVGEVFPPQRVAVAQGTISAMFAVGAALGLLGGAWITQTYGWQTTYHSIVPLAIAAPVVVYLVLSESRFRHRVPLDVPGAVLLGGALGSFLVGLSQGPTWGWGDWSAVDAGGLRFGTPTLLVIALVLFVGFLLWEPRSPNPMVDFARLKQRNIILANLSGIAAASAMFVFFVSSQTILQVPTVGNGLGQTTFYAGVASVPACLAMLFLSPLMGRAVGRLGPKPVMTAGGLLVILGGLAFATFNRTVIEASLDAIPILIGVIASFIAMTNIVVLSSGRHEAGVQTGMNQTFRNIGSAIGPVLASVIISSFGQTIVETVPTAGGPVVVASFTVPSLDAYRYAFYSVAALGAVMLVLSLFLRNYRFGADGSRTDAAHPEAAPVPSSVSETPAVAA